MRKSDSNDELMTTRQVAEALGVAVRTVQLWVESGALPAWRTAGGHRRISRGAVEQLRAERSRVIDAPNAELAPPRSSGRASPRSFQILLVEDDPLQAHLFQRMAQEWKLPIEVTLATNGFEGLIKIGQIKPDLIVTDLNMPGMDGFQMLRSLAHIVSKDRPIEIVVITAYTPSEIADRGGLPDTVAVFKKPISFSSLRQRVEVMMASRQRQSQSLQ
jgi:excisionase family DNA binding protein